MKKSEAKKLEDKDLQLRYYLSVLKDMTDNAFCHCWSCDMDCSFGIMPNDERLNEVKKFIKKHNITNEMFLKLSYNFLIGATMKYHDSYSQLFLELEKVLKPYQFTQSNRKRIPDNNFREKELEKLAKKACNPNSIIGSFIKKYNLTFDDFIIIAKTFLNYNMYGLRLTNQNDRFITEFKYIIEHYNLSVPKEYIQKYIRTNQCNESSQNTKGIQRIFKRNNQKFHS